MSLDARAPPLCDEGSRTVKGRDARTTARRSGRVGFEIRGFRDGRVSSAASISPVNLDSPIGRQARRRCGSERSNSDGSWTSSPPFGFRGESFRKNRRSAPFFDILTVGKKKWCPFLESRTVVSVPTLGAPKAEIGRAGWCVFGWFSPSGTPLPKRLARSTPKNAMRMSKQSGSLKIPGSVDRLERR